MLVETAPGPVLRKTAPGPVRVQHAELHLRLLRGALAFRRSNLKQVKHAFDHPWAH
jgi:hypothetical protein